MKKVKKKTKITEIITNAWVFRITLILVFIFSFQVQALEYKDYEKKIRNSATLRNVIEKMTRKEIEESLRAFVASGRPSRLVGSPGHKNARAYLEKKILSMSGPGAAFTKQDFTDPINNGAGVNLIWEKKGALKPEEVIILGANYDTLLKDPKTRKPIFKGEMPGADNNGSGVSILLSMIEILNQLELPKTVRIVFFDYEELGNFGSKAFALKTKNELGNQKIVGVINLTMLAHDSKTTDIDHKFNNMSVYVRPKDQTGFELDSNFAKMITVSGKLNYSSLEFSFKESMSGNFFAETAQNFWAQGLPAVTLSQNRESDLNPRYMTSNDFVETLNINTYTNVFKYVTSAVLAWNYDIVK